MATQTRGPAPEKAAKPGRPAKQDRTTPARFVREVMQELRKVVWPTRKELVTYTTVALVFILIMVGDRHEPGLRVHEAGAGRLRLRR